MQTMIEDKPVGYSESGTGIPLVLVHGYPLNRRIWEPQLSGLQAVAHMIAPDLWGFGESGTVTQATVGTYADQVHALLAERGIKEPVVLCGLSMGGYIVFEFLRRYHQQVAAVILANTKAGPDSAEGKEGRNKSAALAKEKGAGAIAEQMLPKMLSPKTYGSNPRLVQEVESIMMGSTVEGIIAALIAMRDRPDSTAMLAEIKQPALVIGGEDDQLFPRAEPEKMEQGLPNGKLVMLPDAGHLSNMEQPDRFNLAVSELLQSL